jgi:hypothetical protein
MDDAGGYEEMLLDQTIRGLLGRLYGTWDLSESAQTFFCAK